MFEISELKAKKLPELQEIAQKLNVPKYRSLKKLDLVYQILDFQAANPDVVSKKKLQKTHLRRNKRNLCNQINLLTTKKACATKQTSARKKA